MLHRLALPPYESVKKYEGTGNFAVSKYYHFPFSFFYQKKLRLILSMLDNRTSPYLSILDFGCGEAKIMEKTLRQLSSNVHCVDKIEDVKSHHDLIVCASVLEFVDLDTVLPILNKYLMIGQPLIGASPMDTWITRLYFKLIGDKHKRNSQQDIMNALEKYFYIVRKKEWMGLYFSFKGYQK